MPPTLENPTSAAQEATEWLIALQDAPDDRELKGRFERWLEADPHHAAMWEKTRRVYAGMDQIGPASEQRVDHRPSRIRGRFVLAVGSALAAALLIFVAPDIALRLKADALTATAEVKLVRLQDGSTVRLAPDSAIDLVLTEGERRVRLLKGQAYFDVAANPLQPFRVEAGTVTATVLGTAFQVGRGKTTDVAVKHGRVRVDYGDDDLRVMRELGAGEWIRVSAIAGATEGTLPPDQVAAWTQGKLIIHDQPFAAVIDQLRPYYKGYIIIGSAGLARQPLTGVYNLDDPVGALHAIASAHGATIRQVSPWLLVISGT